MRTFELHENEQNSILFITQNFSFAQLPYVVSERLGDGGKYLNSNHWSHPPDTHMSYCIRLNTDKLSHIEAINSHIIGKRMSVSTLENIIERIISENEDYSFFNCVWQFDLSGHPPIVRKVDFVWDKRPFVLARHLETELTEGV